MIISLLLCLNGTNAAWPLPPPPPSLAAHAQRLQKLQSLLRRAPSYRTLELQLIEWQERELFEYFVVVSLKKKPTKNSYCPEVTYQFPKVPRPMQYSSWEPAAVNSAWRYRGLGNSQLMHVILNLGTNSYRLWS